MNALTLCNACDAAEAVTACGYCAECAAPEDGIGMPTLSTMEELEAWEASQDAT